MIAEDGSITRLVDQTNHQVRQVQRLFHRISAGLIALQGGSEEAAEGGWRRYRSNHR